MKKLPIVAAFLLPRPRDILFIGVLFSIVFWGPKLFNDDGDLGRHITIGNYILDTGTIPTRDIFSHTMTGERLVPHEWLAQVIFALAHRVMGLNGDVFIAALLGGFTVLIVYQELIKRGGFRLVALSVATWVAVVSSVHWLARPHMFTFLFVVIWTYGLEHFYKDGRRNSWMFPALMLVWVNTHGAFIAGFVVLGTYIADWLWEYMHGRGTKEMGWQLFLIGVLSFAVTFVNPAGIYLWGTSVGYVSNDFMTSHTLEYRSPNFHELGIWPFMFMVGFALFALMQERKVQLREALLLAGWTMMSLYSVRNLPLFAVITAPIYGSLIQPWAEGLHIIKKWDVNLKETEILLRGYAWIIGAILFFGFILWRGIPLDENGKGNVFLPNKMPVQAVDWLEENPQDGRVFNSFTWGGYILYRLWPTETVFIDGQTDFYGEALTREYITVVTMGDGWENILDKYDVSWIIVPRTETLAKYLYSVNDDAWRMIYEDDTAVIFRR